MRTKTCYSKQLCKRRRLELFGVVGIIIGVVGIIIFNCCLIGCKENEELDKSHLNAFHEAYFSETTDVIETHHVSLYVDYSTCVKDAQEKGSPFFDAIKPWITEDRYVKEFYAVRQKVNKESGRVYDLLNTTVEEIEGADIKTAAETIAEGNTEGILITDGEYYIKGNSLFNENSTWMSTAIKTWLLKGHEIYIFAEPYKEKGKYDKKRYYFIFTDTRFTGNIFDFINSNINASEYTDVKQYHLTANPSHYSINFNTGNTSTPHSILNCKPSKPTNNSRYEVQIWEKREWKDIYRFIVKASDNMGNGKAVITGLTLDKNASGGCFRINDIDVRVSNISKQYQVFCRAIDSGQEPKQIASQEHIDLKYADNFFTIDRDDFIKHSNINVYFDRNNFASSLLYNKKCGNLLKIDFVVKS